MSIAADKPLAGKKIVVTRARAQAEKLAKMLDDLGATVIEFPTIEIRPVQPPPPIPPLQGFDWIIFTSVNGVNAFLDAVGGGHPDLDLRNCRVCAVGPGTTTALRSRGVRVDLIPDDYRQEGVLEALQEHDPLLRGKHILLPKGDLAREFLPEQLRALGAVVTELLLLQDAVAAAEEIAGVAGSDSASEAAREAASVIEQARRDAERAMRDAGLDDGKVQQALDQSLKSAQEAEAEAKKALEAEPKGAGGRRRITIGLYGTGEDNDRYVRRPGRFRQLEDGIAYVRERYGQQVSLTLNWLLMRPTCSIESVRETWRFAARYDTPIYSNLVHYSLPYFTEGEDRELQFRDIDRPAIESVVGEILELQRGRPDLLRMSPVVLRSIPDYDWFDCRA